MLCLLRILEQLLCGSIRTEGRVDGIEGYVDMNVAYFSYDSDADPFDPDKPHDDINVAELGIVFKNVDETVSSKGRNQSSYFSWT